MLIPCCVFKGETVIWYVELDMQLTSLINRMKRRALRFRLRPIRVFCFHQVSNEFEPETMKKCDWMQTDAFKQSVFALKKRYTFISLPEVSCHLKYDRFRVKRYAALTSDDGWASLKNVLPWLDEQNVPVTLFLNPCYMDGKHYREKDTEKYLSMEEVLCYGMQYKDLTVALHGWEHKDVSALSNLEFRNDVEQSFKALSVFPCFVPFFAYPWGRHNDNNDAVLFEYGMTPVLMDGMVNYTDPFFIHREMLK